MWKKKIKTIMKYMGKKKSIWLIIRGTNLVIIRLIINLINNETIGFAIIPKYNNFTFTIKIISYQFLFNFSKSKDLKNPTLEIKKLYLPNYILLFHNKINSHVTMDIVR